jgi:serine/threonine protein phosphatase PrpC
MKKGFLILLVVSITTFFLSASDNRQIAYVAKTILPAGYFSSANGKPQYDALAMHSFDKVDFFTVCDGYNGVAVSDYIAKKLHEKLSISFDFEPAKDVLASAFSELETEALSFLGGGSTVITACVDTAKKILHLAWAGNCRALLELDGKVNYATSDHVLENKDEMRRVQDSKAVIFRELVEGTLKTGRWRVAGLEVTRAIGDRQVKGMSSQPLQFNQPIRQVKGKNVYLQLKDETLPDVGTFVVAPKAGQVIATPDYCRIPLANKNRWLILASDGVWNVLSSERVINLLKPNGALSPQEVANLLVQAAIEKGSSDNITAIVIDLLPLFEKK